MTQQGCLASRMHRRAGGCEWSVVRFPATHHMACCCHIFLLGLMCLNTLRTQGGGDAVAARAGGRLLQLAPDVRVCLRCPRHVGDRCMAVHPMVGPELMLAVRR
jgi:hypothetical protein